MAFVKFEKGGNKKFGPRDIREVKAGEVVELADNMVQRYGDTLKVVKKGTADSIDPGATSELDDFEAKKAGKRADAKAKRDAITKAGEEAVAKAKADKKAAASKKKGASRRG